jgi:hypothetical protein
MVWRTKPTHPPMELKENYEGSDMTNPSKQWRGSHVCIIRVSYFMRVDA